MFLSINGRVCEDVSVMLKENDGISDNAAKGKDACDWQFTDKIKDRENV